jgi:ubiquinone/menaquinone biosynthesis C-methylase UbiE
MPEVNDFSLLVDLHKGSERQGPGGVAETGRALELACLPDTRTLRVIDIGCGTGASTLQLARSLDARVTAVDLSPEFIRILSERSESAGLKDNIEPVVATMEALPFKDGEFDLLWSEGAVYNMGFEQGVTAWRRLLVPGGALVVSEITWTTGSRPEAVQQYWQNHYPEIDTAGGKMAALERSGYSIVAYFILPEQCWLENYYKPLQAEFRRFIARHPGDARAIAVMEAEQNEIAFYREYRSYYSYGMYVARKA